ncbi:MAG: BCCT family transporter [Gammaproteobacteria bacterium]
MASKPEEIMQFNRSSMNVHPQVFFFSVAIILVFILFTLLNLDTAESVFAQLMDGTSTAFGWLFILGVQVCLLFCLYLAMSRFGHIRLGGPDATPEFSRPAWFSMLFCAGMGIGLMFWGVAEPISHFQNPPRIEGLTTEAAVRAMDLTFLHWGFHAWSIYALVGLSLAYFSFNLKLPLTIRSAFYPVLGRHIHGNIGNMIDILAVVATLFGVATSLGLGVAQINTGLNYLFDIEVSSTVQIGLIFFITTIATLSVVSGLNRGILRLSQFNFYAAIILLLFLLVLGPTLFLLKSYIQNTGHYLQNLLTLGSWTETYSRDPGWIGSWTIFYWAWWIAWSPFVGMFIARISKGRTVREFILVVLFIPSALTFIWITTFGGTAIFNVLNGDTSILVAVEQNVATALFELLDGFPLASVTSVLSIMLIFVFFVTSSDSGSLVIDIITAGGNLDPPIRQRIFWAVTEGVVAAVLLIGGGLTALRAATISSGLPFMIVLMFMGYCLLKAFRKEMPPYPYNSNEVSTKKTD